MFISLIAGTLIDQNKSLWRVARGASAMAVVRRLEQQTLEKGSPHTEVECTYSIVDGQEGRYLQIDTYGSTTRKIPGKKSQSIRFAPEAIKQLKTLLEEHF
jgi:hypothetical protein